MDWLTFISSLISSLAWPCAVVLLALLFRRNLGGLLMSLRSVKHGDTEVVFREGIEEAKALSTDKDVTRIPADKELLDLIETHPRLAIMEAFQRLEEKMRMLSKKEGGPETHPVNRWQAWANQREFIGRDQAALLISLQNLRNVAAHDRSRKLTSSDAYEFVEMANYVNAQIEHRLAGGTGYVSEPSPV